MTTFLLASSGVHLSVTTSGDPDAPAIVLVHGFPDSHAVWDRIVPLLEPDFFVVTYDVRGAGASSAPATRRGYAIGRLVDDLVAVIGRVRPGGEPVHLVGHDWGSVQLWGAVMREADDARLSGRIASFTSISGPGLDLFGHFIATGIRQLRLRTLAHQLAHSWYIAAFQLPYLPELVFRRFGGRLRRALTAGQQLGDHAHWSDTFSRDGANGVNLYRANRLSFTRGTTRVPVQLIVPVHDAFIDPAMFDDVERFAPDLSREDLDADHWVVRTQPEIIAGKIRAFVAARG